eukprot:7582290-Alexandrium_andersonii.AAC.1
MRALESARNECQLAEGPPAHRPGCSLAARLGRARRVWPRRRDRGCAVGRLPTICRLAAAVEPPAYS